MKSKRVLKRTILVEEEDEVSLRSIISQLLNLLLVLFQNV